MKRRRPKSEQQAKARDELKSVKDWLQKPLVLGEPFDYAARGRQVQEAQRWNIIASGLRFRPPSAPAIWDIHRATAERFWAAVTAAYPPAFWEEVQKLREGKVSGLETAICFLEADPMFFRTGYLKTWLIRALKPPMLTPSDQVRLQGVVLSLVDRRDDRDFRTFCKLARKVDGPGFKEQLMQRLGSPDADTRRRAGWVLDALAQKDRMEAGRKKPTATE